MTGALKNRLRQRREERGLSQRALGDRAGVSRQAILAIEAARQVPSTSLALRLARVLRCDVEDLFTLGDHELVDARLDARPGAETCSSDTRVAMAEVGDEWVAHPLPEDAALAADGLVSAVADGRAVVQPLVDRERLRAGVIVTGCAPLIGMLAGRVRERYADARATWIPAGSRRSLDLLEDRLVHIAGLHATNTGPDDDNVAVVRGRFPDRRILVVNLTRWRQGLVLPQGNPRQIRSVADLLRPDVRFAHREAGAGAHELLRRLLTAEGATGASLDGPAARGHVEVARLVQCGAADAGIAIEGVALDRGLSFVPLSAERFDLVIPAELADWGPVSRLVDVLDRREFRAEVARLPGYDSELSGHVTTLEAA